MFIATTQTPDKNIQKEKAQEDFTTLLGRTCEYIKELEELGHIENGSYFNLYEEFHKKAQQIINENWK